MDILVGTIGKILLKYQPLLANMYMDGTNNQVPKSWRVTGHICPVLGQPDGYSVATTIVTRGSNRAVGVLMC
ncbi:unnamed protein product [Sphagnum troendelagicum]